jgi:hypothetical protein
VPPLSNRFGPDARSLKYIPVRLPARAEARNGILEVCNANDRFTIVSGQTGPPVGVLKKKVQHFPSLGS